MGGEDGTDGQVGHFHIEQAGARHPLVELGQHLLVRFDIVANEALNHLTGCIAEEGRLDIIPAAADGVHTEAFPQLSENIVLVADERREIDQDRYRLAGDIPVADTDAEPFFRRMATPRAEQSGIFRKFRVLPDIAPDIGADMDMMMFLKRGS